MNFSIKLFTSHIRWQYCLAIILIVSGTLFAADEEGTYHLNELIEAGLANSPERKTEDLRLLNSKSSLRTSYLDFLPHASIHTTREYTGESNTASGLSISKSIYLNDPSYFNWRRAGIDILNSRLSYTDNMKQIVFEIFSRYVRVSESAKRVQIQEQNLAIQERIMEQMRLLYRLEQRSLIDLKQTEISLINAQIALEEVIMQHSNARENLFLYLNVEDQGYPLADIDIPISESIPEYRTVSSLYVAENNLQKTEISLLQSRLNFLPNLSLNYAYRATGRDDVFDFDSYEDSYTISLSASYQLFNYIEHREHHHRSKREMMIQQLNLENMEANSKKQYEQMIRDLQREKRLYELAQRREELAEEALELARSRFNLGVLSLLELEQAIKGYNESIIEVSTRYYQRILKQEELNLFLSETILGRW